MKMIQLRNVPDSLHRKFKIRAAENDLSLTDYLLSEMREIVDRPTINELIQKVSQGKQRKFDSQRLVRQIRDGAAGN
jgi:antitoxin FitA